MTKKMHYECDRCRCMINTGVVFTIELSTRRGGEDLMDIFGEQFLDRVKYGDGFEERHVCEECYKDYVQWLENGGYQVDGE